eukprot:2951483-Pyramimonas_sp.AAC.1
MYEAKDGPVFDRFTHLVGTFQVVLSEVEAGSRKKANQEWREWLLFKAHRGARRVHLVSKGATPWTPTTTLSLDGVAVADPVSLLKAEASKFSQLWGDGGTGSWFEIGEVSPPLPPVPVEAI